jgi:galactosylceramidase
LRFHPNPQPSVENLTFNIMPIYRSLLSRVVLASALVCLTASARADQTVILRGDAGGKRFDGIGALSGGGATSVLLKDYPEPQRSQILDLFFKPKFGASMSAFMVEVPGDSNSTQGSEPSHMHTRDDLNFYRGYEWWLLSEAKKRNRDRDLTLDANAWGAPGWVGGGNFWSQDMADYYVKWIQGLKSEHGVDLDAIGCRNEKGYNLDFVKKFRATLNAAGLQKVKLHGFDNWGDKKFEWIDQLTTDAELRNSVDIISNHTMSEIPIPPRIQELVASLNKPLWNSEEHVYKKGYDCEISLVKAFNDNYIDSGVTKIINWYLSGSVYPIEPYPEEPAALMANSPWSGHYRPREVLWGYAHYGQFSKVGWTYLNGGSGKLDGGGSFVTLKSPGRDYSVIFETKGAKAPQKVTFQVGGGLSPRSLCVWKSDIKEQFVPQAAITPKNGVFTLTIEPDTIISISTTRGQRKGSFSNVPAQAKFPFPYYETFDSYASAKQVGYLPRHTADIVGVFELAERPDKTGKALRQVIGQKAQSWAPEWMPYTIIGDRDWSDYEVSADILLDNGGWAGVMGRVNEVGTGYGTDPKGYTLRLSAEGICTLVAVNGRAGAEDLGDKEHQERLRAEAAAAAAAGVAPADKGENSVGAGKLANFSPNRWHNLKLRFAGQNITGFVDGVQILSVTNARFARGMAGLVTGDANTRNTAYFDNLLINRVGAATPLPTKFARNQLPIYKK